MLPSFVLFYLYFVYPAASVVIVFALSKPSSLSMVGSSYAVWTKRNNTKTVARMNAVLRQWEQQHTNICAVLCCILIYTAIVSCYCWLALLVCSSCFVTTTGILILQIECRNKAGNVTMCFLVRFIWLQCLCSWFFSPYFSLLFNFFFYYFINGSGDANLFRLLVGLCCYSVFICFAFSFVRREFYFWYGFYCAVVDAAAIYCRRQPGNHHHNFAKQHKEEPTV